MKLVVNALDPLSPGKCAELLKLIGPYHMITPVVDGDDLYRAAFKVMNDLEDAGRDTLETSQSMREGMLALIARLDIHERLWELDVVLLLSQWSYAGIEMMQSALIDAFAERSGKPVYHMCFGNKMLCDDKLFGPHEARPATPDHDPS